MNKSKTAAKPAPEQSPLDRTASLMRRILQAQKPKAGKPKKRKH